MKRFLKSLRVALYAVLLSACIGGAYIGLSKMSYFKDYLEGFLSHNIQFEKRAHHLADSSGLADIVTILDVSDTIVENYLILADLVDSIMSYSPSVLGIDIQLVAKDTSIDRHLYQTITRYENIVLPYSKEDNKYPLDKPFDAFTNVCYTNFEALEDMPRRLAPYDRDSVGALLTSFWARLWEIHAGIPNGQLKSKREFIDFNVRPTIHTVDSIALQDPEHIIHDVFQTLRGKIIIIGCIRGKYGGSDIFHVPIRDKNSELKDLYDRHLMTGVEIIGRAVLTIGENEIDDNRFDKHRREYGGICFFILVCLFCLIHFAESESIRKIGTSHTVANRIWYKIIWCFEKIRSYGNFFQFLAGVGLFVGAKKLSPSMDEQWFIFSIIALFLLLAPVIADIENFLYKRISHFINNHK